MLPNNNFKNENLMCFDFFLLQAKTKKRQFTSIDNKYGSSNADNLEAKFSQEIVGLVSAKEFKEKRAKIDEMIRYG